MINQRKVGVVLSYASIGINIIANFLYVPILLKFLGQSEYGLYQLLGAFVTYAAIFDFGLSNAVTRHYCLFKTTGETEKMQNMLFWSRLLFYAIDAIILVVGVVFYFLLGEIYPKLTSEQLSEGKLIFIVLVINVLITIPSYTDKAILDAEEKFIFSKGLRVVSAILQPVLVILLIMESPTALTVVIVQTAVNFLVVVSQRLYVWLKIKPTIKKHGFDKSLLKNLFAFSIFIFINTMINELNWQAGKTVLGIMSGTDVVTTLSSGIYIASAFMQFSYNVSNVFYPQFSVLAAKGDEGDVEINNIFVKVGRIQCLVLGLVFSGFIIFGKEFVVLWAGAQNVDAFYIAIILLSATFISNVENAGILVLQAKQLHKWRSLTIIFAIIGVVISVLLVPEWGAIGCSIGTAFAYFFGYVVFLNYVYIKKAKLKVFTLFKSLVPNLVLLIVLSVVGWFINDMIKTEGWLMLFVKIICYTLLYCMLCWLLIMNKYEKSLIIKPIKLMISRITRKEDRQSEDK